MLLILLLAAFVLFLLAAIRLSTRISPGWLGMACLTAYGFLARVVV
jgi:hypothetical protein